MITLTPLRRNLKLQPENIRQALCLRKFKPEGKPAMPRGPSLELASMHYSRIVRKAITL
ncbi:hypothetical protein [Pseudomonas putida]|uniref:hypothetical protein n=1 Tax=Pseudomonas putida TaxID=303 RepID=UPI003D999CBE